MRIAIIGSGAAGITAAHLLHRQHDISVYESGSYVGGHVNTIDVSTENTKLSIDTGFIVFNDWTYPNFENLISTLDIQIQNSEMSFSAQCEESGFEWSGNGLKGLIVNSDNWKQPKSYQIFYDIVRFKKLALAYLEQKNEHKTLGDFLGAHNFSKPFIKYYILPMGAAIWSSTLDQINDYPCKSFLTFFKNHGLLNLKVRPQWKTIVGGSKRYVAELTKPFKNKIHTNTEVTKVKKIAGRVEIFSIGRPPEYFDHVFFACHSDQALALLDQCSPNEETILGAIQYQKNIAILHTDESTMPKRKNSWSSWNYFIPRDNTNNANVTYYMNRLQNLHSKKDYFVTLNPCQDIIPSRIINTIEYMHPVFNSAAIHAQKHYETINGQDNTWFCGAYWRNGFHEDGVWSAIRAVDKFNRYLDNEELHLQRAS